MDDNKIYKFRTNINCGGCVATVKPHLDKAKGIGEWNVDTTNKEKILTVKSGGISEKQIMDTVQKAGYKIESLNN
ncbi:MAG: hypothetical protein B6D37_14340 [Sphingobacteriales bacterium UTBCD1]|jgi:copper chaperone CopZ|nr:MAG: hypothetical protein B6D37_14340 [Sphingobacteriales bacterium UTBCD1]